MHERRVDWKTAAWLLWRLERGGRDIQCVLGLVPPYGLQARFVFDGRLLSEYLFANWAEASAWSRQRRSELEADGWIFDPSSLQRRAAGEQHMSAGAAMSVQPLNLVGRGERPTPGIEAQVHDRRRLQ
jgi:hypothetical protein